MKRLLIAFCLLTGCDPTERYTDWTYVGAVPDGGSVYKKHFAAEHATVYYMNGRYGSISVVKD